MSKLCWTILLAVAALTLAAAPASAGQEPAPMPTVQAPAAASQPGCASAPVADLFAANEQAPVCKPSIQSALTPQPEFLVSNYRGYCQCGCSNRRNCNTDADCFGGGRCLGGITCC